MIVTSRRDRNSGDAKVAGTSRSPLLRLPMRSEFFRPSKNQELLAPAAPDCAWFKSIEQDLRRRARLEAECLAEFNQPAALSTYQRGKSVRTTRATAVYWSMAGVIVLMILALAPLISEYWLQSKQLSQQAISHAVMLMGVVVACRWPIGLYQGALIGAQRLTVSSGINMAIATIGTLEIGRAHV